MLSSIKLSEVGMAINKPIVNLNRRKDPVEPILFLKRPGQEISIRGQDKITLIVARGGLFAIPSMTFA